MNGGYNAPTTADYANAAARDATLAISKLAERVTTLLERKVAVLEAKLLQATGPGKWIPYNENSGICRAMHRDCYYGYRFGAPREKGGER